MRTRWVLLLPLVAAACAREAARAPARVRPTPLNVTPAQFRSLQWLEGQWRGTQNDSGAFYEGYRFLDDSTMRSYGYRDSTLLRGDSSVITLRGGVVQVGDSVNGYVVTQLDSSMVHFEPNPGANNAFTWRRSPDGNWTATLNWTEAGTPRVRVYTMRRLNRQ